MPREGPFDCRVVVADPKVIAWQNALEPVVFRSAADGGQGAPEDRRIGASAAVKGGRKDGHETLGDW